MPPPPAVARALAVLQAAAAAPEPAEFAESAAAVAAGGTTPSVGEACEVLLGYARLWWQLTRLHRGLLGVLAADAATADGKGGAAALLWSVCRALPDAVRNAGYGEASGAADDDEAAGGDDGGRGGGGGGEACAWMAAATAGRLSHFVLLLLDGIDAAAPEAGVAAADAASFVQLELSALGWLDGGDEDLAHALLTSLLLSPRWLGRLEGGADVVGSLRPALLEPYAQLLRRGGGGGGGGSGEQPAAPPPPPPQLGALRWHTSHRALPLPSDWVTAPLFQFGVDASGVVDERAVRAQVLAALRALLLWLPLAPLRHLPRARLLCRGLQLFEAPSSPWRDAAVAACMRALLDALTGGTGGTAAAAPPPLLGAERGVDVQGLVERTLRLYASDSYGDAAFTQWALLPLRTREPDALRVAAWQALEEVGAQLAMPPPRGALDAWRAAAPAAAAGASASSQQRRLQVRPPSTALLDAFEASLRGGKLGRSDNFLYRLALHHLASAAFGGAGAAAAATLPQLLATLPAAALLDLCCTTDLDTPATLPSRADDPAAAVAGLLPESRLQPLRLAAKDAATAARLPPPLVTALGLGTVV